LEPAETAEVEIHRGGEARVLKVKLGERPLGSTSGGWRGRGASGYLVVFTAEYLTRLPDMVNGL
jgi:hypothetical protein